jgi:hypothetical protein
MSKRPTKESIDLSYVGKTSRQSNHSLQTLRQQHNSRHENERYRTGFYLSKPLGGLLSIFGILLIISISYLIIIYGRILSDKKISIQSLNISFITTNSIETTTSIGETTTQTVVTTNEPTTTPYNEINSFIQEIISNNKIPVLLTIKEYNLTMESINNGLMTIKMVNNFNNNRLLLFHCSKSVNIGEATVYLMDNSEPLLIENRYQYLGSDFYFILLKDSIKKDVLIKINLKFEQKFDLIEDLSTTPPPGLVLAQNK